MSFEHIFDELEIGAEPFALCELRGRCDLPLGRLPRTILHYILAGEGEISVAGAPPLRVCAGSLVLIPAGSSHALHSFGGHGDPLPACRPAELNLERHLAEGMAGHGQLLALCTQVTLGLRGAHGLIDLIRAPLTRKITPGDIQGGPVTRILGEICMPRTGSRAMLRALLLECMIGLLRDRIEAGDGALAWMEVLSDRSIWAALRLMLERPAGPHSVESLAMAAGLGRSSFAKRFAAAYGSGPMDLLRDLRMRMAADLLNRTDLPVERIAGMAGFQSRSAFTRAFTAATGTSPGAYRAARAEA